jgi:hypothetical protein
VLDGDFPFESIADSTPSSHPVRPAGYYPFLSPTDRPGELGRLGPYRVVKLLGEGGMGFVFRGEDEGLLRPVALKVMRPEVAADPALRYRFTREGRAAAGIKSDHVITIYQVGEANGVPFLAMEYLDGLNLDDWLNAWRKVKKKAIPATVVVRVAKDVLKGLMAAHEKGMIHRDIKPANLWVESGTSRVKLLDFGLTRGGESDKGLTRNGQVLGTPAYMAPEQARGLTVDARADLFSVGVVLYRMIAGRNPFQRDSVFATLTALAIDHPPPANSFGVVPEDLAGLIDRLMAKSPDGRPATTKAALAVVVEVERQLRGQAPASPVVAAVPISPVVRPPAPPVVAPVPAAPVVWPPARPAPVPKPEVVEGVEVVDGIEVVDDIEVVNPPTEETVRPTPTRPVTPVPAPAPPPRSRVRAQPTSSPGSRPAVRALPPEPSPDLFPRRKNGGWGKYAILASVIVALLVFVAVVIIVVDNRQAAQDSAYADHRAASLASQKAADRNTTIQKAVDEKAADQKAADQKAADQKAADQKAADQKAADQAAANKWAAEQAAAEKRAAELKSAVPKAVDLRITEFREWSKPVIASSKDLRSRYDKAEIGMTLAYAGKLKDEVSAHLEVYFNKTSTAGFTAIQLAEAGVKQIEEDEADWKQLLYLIDKKFTSKPTDMTPTASEKWLLEVNNVFRLVQGKEAKASVQRKTQQFCNKYIPDNLALDQTVIDNRDRIYERDKLRVRYKRTNGVPQDLPLTSDPDGINEVTYNQKGVKPEGFQFEAFLYEGERVFPSLKLTPKSVAAFIYRDARKPLQDNWTSAALTQMYETLSSEMKKKQIPHLEGLAGEIYFWNGLKSVGGGEPQVYDRLRVVGQAIGKYPDLFTK